MASKEDLKSGEATKKRIGFLASCVDQFMQDFLTKASANDKLGTIVASARLAQIGAVLTAEYEESCNQLVDSDTEKRVADQAAAAVVKLVNDNADVCRGLMGDAPEASAEDHSSN